MQLGYNRISQLFSHVMNHKYEYTVNSLAIYHNIWLFWDAFFVHLKF